MTIYFLLAASMVLFAATCVFLFLGWQSGQDEYIERMKVDLGMSLLCGGFAVVFLRGALRYREELKKIDG